MKKKTIILVASLLLGNLLPRLALAQDPVQLEKVGESVYLIKGGKGSNGGLIIGDKGVLVIDAKMDSISVAQTLEEIQKLANQPVHYLANTHSDGDHVWGNQYFPENTIIVAHENCRQEFFHPKRDGSPSGWDAPTLLPFVPAITFRDKMDLFLGNKKVELWYFGVGHTKGDAVVYVPDEKIVFVGDLVFTSRPQLIHSYKGGNSFEYLATTTKMLETLDIVKICSGHSEVLDRQAMTNQMGKMKEYHEKIKAMIDGGKNLEEIKSNFGENEARLVETIYNEITNP